MHIYANLLHYRFIFKMSQAMAVNLKKLLNTRLWFTLREHSNGSFDLHFRKRI